MTTIVLSDIFYIEAKGKLTVIHTKEKNLVSNTSLVKFVSELPQKSFVRIHKSYVINTKYFHKAILKDNEIFVNEEILPIGRAYKEKFFDRFKIL